MPGVFHSLIQKGPDNMNLMIQKLIETDYERAQNLLATDKNTKNLTDALEYIPESLYGIWDREILVGIAQLKQAYLHLFIAPAFRRNHYGTEAEKLCLEKFSDEKPAVIHTSFRQGPQGSISFARKLGYTVSCSSACMKYSGPQFELPALPIRTYLHEDYDAAHALCARAFHEMRMRVGGFPDSQVEPPCSQMREEWGQTANERLVYLLNGDIVGYAHVIDDEIDIVAVKPELQGQGIGRGFVKYLCNTILNAGHDSVYLGCVTGNWARDLYESLGFHELYADNYAEKAL